MRVVPLIIVNEFNAARGIDDLQLLLLLGHLVHEVLHACSIDHKGIRFLKRLHIIGHQLIIMQTAGLRFRHIIDFNAVHTVGDVDGRNVHGIE